MNKPHITALITVQENIPNSNLPDANFKDFGGKPLFRLMIDKLLAVSTIDRVIITTDSDAVKTLYSAHNKISLLGLPDAGNLSDNTSEQILEEMPTSDRFTAHALDKIQGEHFMQTQCVNPLLSVRTIEDAIDRYHSFVLNDEYEQHFDSVMSLYRIEKRLYDNNDFPKIKLRNEPHFTIVEDTIFNVFNRTAFNRNGKRKFGKNPMFFEVPEIESLAVESVASYKLAKLAFENPAVLE